MSNPSDKPSDKPSDDLRNLLRQVGEQVRQVAVDTGIEERLPPQFRAPPAEPRPLEEVQAELDGLVGLETVKEQVRNQIAFLQIQRAREGHGLAHNPTSRHLAFLGNPGTGKTTVARLIAEMYHSIGLVERGHLVETDRAGLVGQYVGHTSAKTSKAIRKALDGVLFIDEAYGLTRENPAMASDFGAEAVETLIKRMEDHRDRLVVIVAGYPQLMEDFLRSNPGLRSRFAREITFPDYTNDELVGIARKLTADGEYTFDDEAERILKKIFLRAARGPSFGNARYARNIFEQALNAQAVRLSHGSAPLDREAVMELTAADFEQAAQAVGRSIS